MNPTLGKAIEEYYSTDSEKSMETLKGLVEKSPEDTILQAFLADSYTKHGKDDDAKALLNGLKDKDLSADALLFVVRAYDTLGHQESAKEVLLKHFSSAAEPATVEEPVVSEESMEATEAPVEAPQAPVEAPKQPEVQEGGKKTRKKKKEVKRKSKKRST